MYHCHIRFYFTGPYCSVFDTVKKMSPLEHFTHEYLESGKPEAALAEQADVIFVNMEEPQQNLREVLAYKGSETEVIVLADRQQILLMADDLVHIKDIWTMPMSDEESAFRFLRWQQTCKMSKDY